MFFNRPTKFKTSLAILVAVASSLCLSAKASQTGAPETIAQPKESKAPMSETEVKPMKPDGGMQMWYYRCARNFRYPIPTDFEFAYIDKTGKVVITGPFNVANDFSNGVAFVRLGSYSKENGKLTYATQSPRKGQKALITPDGELVLLNQDFELVGKFFDDLTPVYMSKNVPNQNHPKVCCELMDKNGKVVTNNTWESATGYSEGVVAVQSLKDIEVPMPTGQNMAGQVRVYGYADKNNKVIIKPQFIEAHQFSEGLAAVCLKNPQLGRNRPDEPRFYHPQDYSYIDKTGKVVIEGPFMEAQPFTNGLAAVMKEGKWGYINKTGEMVIPCQYDWAGDFSGKLAPVERDLKVGYIDASGNTVIPFKFKDAREFTDGLAPATLDARRWGYIGENGEFKIAPLFQRAFPFNSGRALVYIDTRKEIDPTAIEPPFMFMAAVNARQDGQLNQARELCHALIKKDPKGKWAIRAQTLLATALPDHDLSPEVAKLYGNGIELANTGKYAEAEETYKKALKIDPKFHGLAGALAYIYLHQKRVDETIELLTKTLKEWPTYARGYWRLSQAYSAKGDTKLAEQNLAKAKSLDPDDAAIE